MDFLNFGAMAGLGVIFWIVFGLGFISLLVSVEREGFSLTFGILAVTIALLCWLAGFNIFKWVIANPATILEGIAIYLVVGVFWGMARWWFFLKHLQTKLIEYRSKYDITRPLSPDSIREFYSKIGMPRHDRIPPLVSEFKKKIVFWMIYWPFSAPWTLINEPVKRFFNMAYNLTSNALQGMSNRMFRNIS
jgi:hypothetical protein